MDTGETLCSEITSGKTEISKMKQIIEAALLAAGTPLSVDKLVKLFPEDDAQDMRSAIREALNTLQQECDGRGYELKQVASGYRFQARQELQQWLSRLWEERPPRYTRALLETLALIAYRQPITRAEIEEVRGVSVSTNIIRTLQEREWICVVGHRDVPGRPALYGSTRQFLDYFDLKSLDELPSLAELTNLDVIPEALELELSAGIAESEELLDADNAQIEGDENQQAGELEKEQETATVIQMQISNVRH